MLTQYRWSNSAPQTDNVSGEQVVYAYDALNRLASATATSGTWGQSYTDDGFGRLTAQNVTAGSVRRIAIPDPTRIMSARWT